MRHQRKPPASTGPSMTCAVLPSGKQIKMRSPVPGLARTFKQSMVFVTATAMPSLIPGTGVEVGGADVGVGVAGGLVAVG